MEVNTKNTMNYGGNKSSSSCNYDTVGGVCDATCKYKKSKNYSANKSSSSCNYETVGGVCESMCMTWKLHETVLVGLRDQVQ